MRYSFVVHGRVQGVGFRYFVQVAGERLGLAGFVRNAWDGTVEGEAEGGLSELEALRVALARGNGFSRVEGVDWGPAFEGAPLPFPFEIRR